jgi:mono/diheme cytochrome c family protein
MNGFRFRSATAVLLGAGFISTGAWTLQPAPASAETETGDRPEIIVPRAGGRATFEKFGCITCHMGDGRGGQNEGGYGADLRVTKLSEQELVKTISEGRAGKGMPAFRGLIDDETLEVLAKYIKVELRLK